MKTRTKVILSTLIALLLLGAAIAAGLNAVFTVTYVRTEFSTFSAEGDRDAAELKEKLDRFVGRSMTFLDLEEVQNTVKDYPHFKIDLLKKNFPSTVELAVCERREEYAFEKEGKYAFLDAEGKFLTDGNPDLKNRAGGQNILLNNFALTVSETGAAEGEYFGDLLTIMQTFKKTLPELRANVVSATLDLGPTDRTNVILYFEMKEGVKLVIERPEKGGAQKAELAMARYVGLSDDERLYGILTVYETAEGEIASDYRAYDPFE